MEQFKRDHSQHNPKYHYRDCPGCSGDHPISLERKDTDMTAYHYLNVTSAMPDLLRELLAAPEVPSRNGSTRELLHTQITLESMTEPYCITPGRKASLTAQVAEVMWMLAGRDDIEWLSEYLPRAADFSDDGRTWRGAYGPRIRRWSGDDNYHGHYPLGHPAAVDQLAFVVDLLKSDPDTRRAVMVIYDPAADSVPMSFRDIPCNNWLHFLIRDGKLHVNVTTRSNDVMWGWSGINVFEWSVLGQLVAALVGVQPGQITFNISSLHLYDRHESKARKIVDQWYGGNVLDGPNDDVLRLPVGPTLGVGQITSLDRLDELVARWFEIEAGLRDNPMSPSNLAAIREFPEPLMRSWLYVIRDHHTDRTEAQYRYSGTQLALAAEETPGYKPAPIQGGGVEGQDTNLSRRESIVQDIARLHADKHAAYGDSWKRRGEMLSILPNIARKVDRLGVDGAGDTAADTAIDLLVYLVKYGQWLSDPEDGGSPERVERELNECLTKTELWSMWTTSTEDRLIEKLKWSFEALAGHAEVKSDLKTERGEYVWNSMVPPALALALTVAEREGWGYVR